MMFFTSTFATTKIQNVIDGGPGVTMARSILNLDIEDIADGTTRMHHENDEMLNNHLDDIIIYPNPSNGEFYIQLDSNNIDLTLDIFDLTGKIVFTTTISDSDHIIRLKLNLPSGLYSARFRNKDEWIKNCKISINN